MVQLASAGRETQLIDLRLLRLETGDRFSSTDRGERCAVVLGGGVEAIAGRAPLGRVGGREDVFDGFGEAIYVPPDAELVFEASTPAVVAVAAAPLGGRAV